MQGKAKPWRDTPAEHVTWSSVTRKPQTSCKHGNGPCSVCGTSERADKPHATVGGKGLVAALRGRR